MKKFWKNDLRKFQTTAALFLVLAGVFPWQCGWLKTPEWVTSLTAPSARVPHSLPVDTPVGSDGMTAAERTAYEACLAQSQVAEIPITCRTPAEQRRWEEEWAARQRAAIAAWFRRNWIHLPIGAVTICMGIASIIFFLRWRKAKKQENMIELPDGTKIAPPPGTKKTKAKLYLPGNAEFKGRTFNHIIGQKQAKVDIQEYLDFVRFPERFEKNPKGEIKIPRGVLLHGYHGTGKTLIVGTLANEVGVPVLVISGSDFIEMYVGVGASRVRELFEYADMLAKHFGWCFVVIDEIDGIGGHRGTGTGGGALEHDQTINQFLVEMDGLIPRPRVITFGTTNLKSKLDPALLRRFTRQIEFFRPTRNERGDLFDHYLPVAWRAAGLNLKQAARTTPGGTGSDIATITNEAKILAARKGPDVLVDNAILDEAIQRVRHGLAKDKSDGLLTEEEQEVIEVHEAGHALTYWKITGKAPERYTIVPRGESGGHVEFSEDGEALRSKVDLTTNIAVALGGWAAVLLALNGREDTGPGSDIQQATKLALEMVKDLGMSELGFVSFDVLKEAGYLSDRAKDRVAETATAIIEEQKVRVLHIMRIHLPELMSLVEAVREKETLLADDFMEAIEKARTAGEEARAASSTDGGARPYLRLVESAQAQEAIGEPSVDRAPHLVERLVRICRRYADRVRATGA